MAFSDIVEIKEARKEIKRQQQILETRLEETNNPRAFQNILNTLGISIEELKKLLTSLMSLEQMGIGLDQLDHIRRQQWERGSEWSAQGYKSGNNGSGGYNQNQKYGYTGY